MRNNISTSKNITDAIYASGFGSNSRFYEQSSLILGMTPEEYKQGGAGVLIQFAVVETSLGFALIASTDAGVCWIDLGDVVDDLVKRFAKQFMNCRVVDADERFVSRAFAAIEIIDTGSTNGSELLPLDLRGTVILNESVACAPRNPCWFHN